MDTTEIICLSVFIIFAALAIIITTNISKWILNFKIRHTKVGDIFEPSLKANRDKSPFKEAGRLLARVEDIINNKFIIYSFYNEGKENLAKSNRTTCENFFSNWRKIKK